MKIFTKKSLQEYVSVLVAHDRIKFMEATARNAASMALHRYACVRTIDDWRALLDEAEKAGTNKYMSMADLIVAAGYKTER